MVSVDFQQAGDRCEFLGSVYAYSPYGQAITLGPDGGNSLQYTGRENDGTGLYYYRARYYDPILKQWLSEDPIGMEGGINLRQYVNGNSISFNDPLGLMGFGGGGSANPGTPMPAPCHPGNSPVGSLRLTGSPETY